MTVNYFFVNKTARIITHISHMSLLSWTLLEIIYFLLHPSAQFVLDFGYSFFALFYIFMVISVEHALTSDLNEMDSYMEKNFWNLKCCGSEFYETLLKRARVGKIFGWIQLIIAATNALLFLPLESDHNELFFVLKFLKDNHEMFYKYYRYFFHTLLSWGTIIVLTQMNIYLYYMVHLDLQYKLLTEHVNNIETDFENDFFKKSYDEEIARRLAVCIAHFQNLTEFRQRFLDFCTNSVSLIIGLGLGVSMFIAYILLVIKRHESILTLTFLWLTVAECTVQLSLIGQHYIDVAEDFYYTLTRCLWYNWSISNKKSFLIFLKYSQSYKTIIICSIIPYNRSLAIWMGRKTVTALTFFRTVKRTENKP